MKTVPTPLEREDALATPGESPEVLVAGAGPVGLFAALTLAEQKVAVQIVDQERRPAARSYALALHPHSLRLLAGAGVAGGLLDLSHRVRTMSFYEGRERKAVLDFSALPGDFPFVAVVPQQTLEGALASQLSRAGVPVLWSHRVAGLRVGRGAALATVERLAGGETLAVADRVDVHPQYLVGADGHRSSVRQALGVPFEEMGPAELFAVFELIGDGVEDSEVRVVFSDSGGGGVSGGGKTGVLWPLGGGRYRWSLQVDEWEGFEEPRFKSRHFPEVGGDPFAYLVRDKLAELLAELAPWFTAEPGEILWSRAVRFERRLAGRFGFGNAWLAGDAAHLASPIGAQSMNVGLREAHDLGRRLGAILREDYPQNLLEGYEAERRREWRQLLKASGLAGAPEPGPAATPWVRQHAGRILPCIPASGADLALLLRQIGLELGD